VWKEKVVWYNINKMKTTWLELRYVSNFLS